MGNELKKISENPEHIVRSTDKGFQEVLNSNKKALLVTQWPSGEFLNQFYDEKSGENLLQRVPETIYEFYVAHTVPKDSPFIETFNFD